MSAVENSREISGHTLKTAKLTSNARAGRLVAPSLVGNKRGHFPPSRKGCTFGHAFTCDVALTIAAPCTPGLADHGGGHGAGFAVHWDRIVS